VVSVMIGEETLKAHNYNLKAIEEIAKIYLIKHLHVWDKPIHVIHNKH
jgi:hypothetical protein